MIPDENVGPRVAAQQEAPMLTVDALDASYNAISALRQVSLRVDAGEAVAVLGSNGAGKSTLLKSISGAMDNTSGSIVFNGSHISGRSPIRICQSGISHVPEGRRCFPGLTVRENLLAAAAPGSMRSANRRLSEVLDFFPVVRDRVDALATDLSGGQQQLVVIARGLMPQPKLLMVDEASLGLSPIAVQEVAAQLGAVREETGLALLLVDQGLGLPLALCSRGYILRQGSIVAEGAISAIVERTRTAYLGS